MICASLGVGHGACLTWRVMFGLSVLMRTATESTGVIHMALQVARDVIHDRTIG